MSTRVEQPRAVEAKRGEARAAAAAERAAARARARHAHRAPFSLRCGALLIDYTVVASIVAFSTIMARVLGDGARATSDLALLLGYVAAAAVAALNFLVLPVFTGRTVG